MKKVVESEMSKNLFSFPTRFSNISETKIVVEGTVFTIIMSCGSEENQDYFLVYTGDKKIKEKRYQEGKIIKNSWSDENITKPQQEAIEAAEAVFEERKEELKRILKDFNLWSIKTK